MVLSFVCPVFFLFLFSRVEFLFRFLSGFVRVLLYDLEEKN